MQTDHQTSTTPRLELWGGHECTVNRVGDRWFDQNAICGHDERPDDLVRFAELGITRLRYPALWERMSPNRADEVDFTWTDERLPLIRELGMEPILTLCHHGSGPHYTSMIDDSFAPGLAQHAAAVAARYPWITDYTPVNEPLTTARFSALYGYWYPHTRDERTFWLALLNEIDATRLAMRAIRAVNPAARLIQTDDLGYCHATAPLAQAAAFQNERRWIGWDLLCGMVTPGHALWDRIAGHGFADRLQTIADDPCPPDVIGLNHYLSSERLLDHRVELHGDRAVADGALGHTDGVVHVDVDAVRHRPEALIGFAGLIEQAWERYGIPVAVTECHLGGTREEQARWFLETWRACEGLRARGVDVPAVTAWSLLGSHDWNRMVTRFIGHYEPGVFDLRGGTPEPTLMADVLAALAQGREPEASVLGTLGWWRGSRDGSAFELRRGPRSSTAARSLVIVGDGPLANLAADACRTRGLHYQRAATPEAARNAVLPWGVLVTDDVPNLDAVVGLCRTLGVQGACLTTAPTDAPAIEELMVVETGQVFGLHDESLAARVLDALDAGDEPEPCGDACWAGIYGPALVDDVLDLMLDGRTGHLRFVPKEQVSEADVVEAVSRLANGHPGTTAAGPAPRCAGYLPPLESMLERFVQERRRLRAAQELEEIQAAE